MKKAGNNYNQLIEKGKELHIDKGLIDEIEKEKSLGHNITKAIHKLKAKIEILINKEK